MKKWFSVTAQAVIANEVKQSIFAPFIRTIKLKTSFLSGVQKMDCFLPRTLAVAMTVLGDLLRVSLLWLMFFNTTYAIDADSVWAKLWGQPEPRPMLGLGMWTYHLKHESEDMDNSQNDLIGFSYRGLFAATFINSENRRSYAAGVQRYWFTDTLKPDLTWQLGYRLGLIYGYDEKLGHIASVSPVIPFPQLISDLTWKHIGWELSYTWVVVSTSFYIRF